MASIHEMLASGDLDLVAAVADEVMLFHHWPQVIDQEGDFELLDLDGWRRQVG
jgi:hypothetical protein